MLANMHVQSTEHACDVAHHLYRHERAALTHVARSGVREDR